MPHTFDDLVTLEQAAAVDAAAAFQGAVTQYAADEGESRVEVEMAVKRAVRHEEG